MATGSQARELLRDGKLDEALKALENEIRGAPADATLRVFLFQLLCVMGRWERAMTQLKVSGELDAINLLMVQVCTPALQCEALRAEVFSGKRMPLVFGQPAEWVGWMVQANQLAAQGKIADSQALRERALEAAPAVSGKLEHSAGKADFEWIADADSRLGPIFEAVIDGRYFWVPFENVHEIRLEKPKDLRDVVWAPAEFTWSNGGTAVGLIPSRYPGSETATDSALVMARATDWTDLGSDLFVGLGQRLIATDVAEYPLLELRKITLGPDLPPPPPTVEIEDDEAETGTTQPA